MSSSNPPDSPASAASNPFQFGAFLPGFDYLQKLSQQAAAQGGSPNVAGMAGAPGFSGWVAPTLSVEELERRITELKTVQFWLDQNSRLLTATVQALEVQKMTIATLKGMNLAMGDMAEAFRIDPQKMGFGTAAGTGAAAAGAAPAGAAAAAAPAAAGVVDPMQWWGALTQQFQQIAASAMQPAAPAGTDSTAAAGAATTPEKGAARVASTGATGQKGLKS